MLQEAHRIYKDAFKRSDWLTRFQLLYLAIVPVVLGAAALYLIWAGMN
ncbi:MAG: hypothetical protein ACOY93_17005 [Bacillota bacterium]